MQQVSLTLIFLALQSQLALASSVNELRSEVDHKISLYQARGELTGRQTIAFQERANVIYEHGNDVLQKQQDLSKLSEQIDQLRKPARMAHSIFTWWY